jgi:hypothetical protein
MTLVDHAIVAKREAEREERRAGGVAWDEIWCVFDEDSDPNLNAAIVKAEASGIRLAVSSPCIELWFILHFEDRSAYIDRRAAQSRARELLGCEKALSDNALGVLGDRHDDAKVRAMALDAKHSGDGSPVRSNPSSEVWKLVDRIRYL